MGLKLASQTRIRRYEDAGYWGEGCLHDYLVRNAKVSPKAPALADAPNREDFAQGPPVNLNTAETLFAVERLGLVFDQLGLSPGDLLAIQLPQIVEAPIAILAAARAGLMVCLLPPHWHKRELLQALSPVGPRAILSWAEPTHAPAPASERPSRLEALREAAAELPSVRFLLAIGDDVPDGIVPLGAFAHDAQRRADAGGPADAENLNANDTSQADDVVLVTWPMSGAPGDRALARSHNEYKATGLAIVNAAGLGDGARLLCPYPLMSYPAIGAFMLPWLLCQGCLVFHRAFEQSRFLTALAEAPTVFTAIPAQIESQVLAALSTVPEDQPPLACLGILRDPMVASLQGQSPPQSPALLDILNLSDLALHTGIRTVSGQIHLPKSRRQNAGDKAPSGFIETHLAPPRAGDAPGAAELFVRSPMTPSAAVGGTGGTFSALQDAEGFVAAGLVARTTGETLVPSAVASPECVVHGGITLNLVDLKSLYSSWPPVSEVKISVVADAIMGTRLCVELRLGSELPPGAIEDFRTFLRQQGAGPHMIADELHIVGVTKGAENEVPVAENQLQQAISAGA